MFLSSTLSEYYQVLAKLENKQVNLLIIFLSPSNICDVNVWIIISYILSTMNH